jgi:predicted metalloprotease
MGLKAITQQAVTQMSAALGDLAIPLTLKKRVAKAYVPGSKQDYTERDITVKGVITRYRQEEIDGVNIQGIDLLVVLFPPTTREFPEANDLVVNGQFKYRVVANSPMYAGSEIAFNLVQVRPPA